MWESCKRCSVSGALCSSRSRDNKKNARAIFEMLGGSAKARVGQAGGRATFGLLSNVPRHRSRQVRVRDAHHPGPQPRPTVRRRRRTNEIVPAGRSGLREVARTALRRTNSERCSRRWHSRAKSASQDVRCVVSVGMLTEGWDCQRVTHILGYRKFGSQLLCEQTMGRALRRRDYDNLEDPSRRRDTKDHRTPFPRGIRDGVRSPLCTAERRKGKPHRPDSLRSRRPRSTRSPSRVAKYRIWVPDFASYTMSAEGVGVALDSQPRQGGLSRSKDRKGARSSG